MQPPIVHLAPGTVIAGKFRVLRLLGVGGMGVVYEIEHDLTKHRRALKLLHSQFCAYPAAVARFLREASAAGRIGNAHIVETFDAGQLDSGEPYIVMEQLEGETLADRIGRESELSVPEISDIVAQSCVGIHAAHERGIVHRDLKPENLFIERRDGKPFIRILDFGVSKFDEALTGGLGLTGEGLALGTPFYMPPEQIRGEKNVDARADVYALGVILYEAITGRRPYEAETLPHLAVLIHEGNAATVESLRPDLPAAFTEIVHRAMASDPAARFPSARELGEALAPFVRDALASSSPPVPATDVTRSADVSRTLESGALAASGVARGAREAGAARGAGAVGAAGAAGAREASGARGGVGPAGTLVSPGGSSHPPPAARIGKRTGSGTPMSAAAQLMPEKRAPNRRWLVVGGAVLVAVLAIGRLVTRSGSPSTDPARGVSPSTDPARGTASVVAALPSALPQSVDAGVAEKARPLAETTANAPAETPAHSAVGVGVTFGAGAGAKTPTATPRAAPPRPSAHAPSRAEQKGLANDNPFR